MCGSSEPHQNPKPNQTNHTYKASGFKVRSLVNFSWDQKVETVAFSLIFKFPSWSCVCSSDPTFCTSSTSALRDVAMGVFCQLTESSARPCSRETSRLCSPEPAGSSSQSGQRHWVSLRMTILVRCQVQIFPPLPYVILTKNINHWHLLCYIGDFYGKWLKLYFSKMMRSR